MLAGIFLLSAAGPARGQAAFRGEAVGASELKQKPGALKQADENDGLLFSFDFRSLREFVKNRKGKAIFRLEIGRQHSWEITLYENPLKPEQAGFSCKTYLGYEGKNPLNTARLFLGDTYFDGFIVSNGKRFEIQPLNPGSRMEKQNIFLLLGSGLG